MRILSSTGFKEESSHPAVSLDYIRGVLHTYAGLNQPDSDLTYEYDIIELQEAVVGPEDLKNNCSIFRNQPLQLAPLTKAACKSTLLDWFFRSGELHHLPLNDTRKNNEVDHFYALLREAIDLRQVNAVGGLDAAFETFPYVSPYHSARTIHTRSHDPQRQSLQADRGRF